MTNPSGEAPMNGHFKLILNPQSHTENISCCWHIIFSYFFPASASCLNPYLKCCIINNCSMLKDDSVHWLVWNQHSTVTIKLGSVYSDKPCGFIWKSVCFKIAYTFDQRLRRFLWICTYNRFKFGSCDTASFVCIPNSWLALFPSFSL
jgi:hypothetical protein